MTGKYKPLWVLLPVFLLVLYVYWSLFFQNMLRRQSAKEIPFGSVIQSDVYPSDGLAIFHFYDPSCLVAQDNIGHLKRLYDRYSGPEAFWYIVTNESIDLAEFQDKLGFEAVWVADIDGNIAASFGVISTPMLVIMDNGKLYFRGTYLKNGAFCGADDITSSDAGMALRSMMKANPLPLDLRDVDAYIGCAL